MKALILASVLLFSNATFAAYACKVTGPIDSAGIADREGGRQAIYITGYGYFKITSSKGSRFTSGKGKDRVEIDFEKNTLLLNGEELRLYNCRGIGE